MYDYLVVGAGLFGSVFAYHAVKRGKKVLVIDRRNHIGGNVYTENIEGINVHKYGAHIFHTSVKDVWDFVGNFAEFNNYVNSPVAVYGDELYNLPFNMNTFSKMWGIRTPAEAKAIIEKQKIEAGIVRPKNLEEQAISLVGRDIYEKLIKGYTEKQWGRKATDLPPEIIKRIPLRFTFDNNYFTDRYQGIPMGGYTPIIEKLLSGADVRLSTDFTVERDKRCTQAKKIVYTGMIDEYYDFCLGNLEYRSLSFDTSVVDTDNYQGNAVVNYTEYAVPYTRIIEHKHFEKAETQKSVITHEYPKEWQKGDEPFYPVSSVRNDALYQKYVELSEKDEKVLFGGRLGKYKYYDMDKVIQEAINFSEKELG